ncbi:MAG: pyridoxamine kinase [Ruminococcaceae bacterium]|nr:pyridoxamine kinase [Oscillospiraceae bacterium]
MEKRTFNENLRIAAIHDISCIGRCSLTVALPVISSMGIETNVIPTAVLSTHTGEFTGYTFRDLTDDILPIARHWKSLNRHFDAFYTGYFGNISQLKIAEEVFSLLADKNTLKFVDPVMADNGELYTNFDKTYVGEMKKFCQKADVIIPNITEACLLAEIDYPVGIQTKDFIEQLLNTLKSLGVSYIILTGVNISSGYGAACFDTANGRISYFLNPHVDGCYYGAGDTLASVLLGKYLTGNTIEDATRFAVDFTYKAIIKTKESGQETKYGLVFEPLLKELN